MSLAGTCSPSRPVLTASASAVPALCATVRARPGPFRHVQTASSVAGGGCDGTERVTLSDGRTQGRHSADGCSEDRASAGLRSVGPVCRLPATSGAPSSGSRRRFGRHNMAPVCSIWLAPRPLCCRPTRPRHANKAESGTRTAPRSACLRSPTMPHCGKLDGNRTAQHPLSLGGAIGTGAAFRQALPGRSGLWRCRRMWVELVLHDL